MKHLQDAIHIIKAHGLGVDGVSTEDDSIDGPEASFFFSGDSGAAEVGMWSGSYPFAEMTPVGILPSLPEACRYAVWLLKREAHYYEKWERLFEEESV